MSDRYLFPSALIMLAAANEQLKTRFFLPPLLGAVLLLAVLSSCAVKEGNTASNASATASGFALTLFDGKELTLANLRGKPVLLEFWASWCPSCRTEAPELERAWRAYKDKGVVFLGVNVQDDEKDARTFLKRFDITFLNGQDNKKEIAESYEVSGLPTTFFITREGKVARRWIGPIDGNQLTTYVEELLR